MKRKSAFRILVPLLIIVVLLLTGCGPKSIDRSSQPVTNGKGVGRTASITIAASNALDNNKAQADVVCDGINDETEINTAIAALSAAGGGEIHLSAGQFVIGASIVIDHNNVAITGEVPGAYGTQGTQIYLADNSNTDMLVIQTNAGMDPTISIDIKNIFFHGNKANQASGRGIYINHGTWINLDSIEVYWAKEEGILISGTPPDKYSSSVHINQSDFRYSDSYGLHTDMGAGECFFTESYFEQNGSLGMYLEGSGIAQPYNLSRNTFGFNTEYALYTNNRVIASGNVFCGRVMIYSNQPCVFVGNRIYWTTTDQYSLVIESESLNSTKHVISGNYIYGRYGVVVKKSTHNIITNNYIYTELTGQSIAEDSGSDYNYIAGNVLDGATTGIDLTGDNTKAFEQQIEIFIDVLAASATHVRSDENLSAAIPIAFTIDGQPDIPRTITWAFDSHVNITAYTMEIVGTDARGRTQTVTWTEAAGWSGETSIAFATITSMTMTSRAGTGVGDTMDIGIGSKLGLANLFYDSADVYKVKKNNADYPAASYTVDTDYRTIDVSKGGAIVGGDDFTVWYRSWINTKSPPEEVSPESVEILIEV